MVKVGLFGAGYLGKLHINNWQEIQEASLIGFYDSNEERAREITDKYKINRFYNEDELIDACEIIDVVSSTLSHFSICEKAIRKSKHVFVEQPMSYTIEEAQQLVKLVQESNVKLQVGQIERFNPAFLAAKKLDLHPMFIEAHRLAQFNSRSTETNIIMDLMIHDIDVVLSIVNSDVKHISANGVGVITEAPDIANVRIDFYNGCVANLTSSRISTNEMRKMRLFQKDAYIEIDFLNKSTDIFNLKGTEETNDGNALAKTSPEILETNALKLELEEFLKAIKHNKRPVVNEIDGLSAMEVAHQILQKIHQNLSL